MRGIQQMLAEGRDCRDVVTQISAANKALEQAGFVLVAAGLTWCLEDPGAVASRGLRHQRRPEDVHEAGLSDDPPRPSHRPSHAARPSTGDGLLARIGRASGRHPRRVLLVWALVILVAAPLAVTLTPALSGAGWEAQGSTAQQVRDELRRDFPQLGAEAAIVAYRQDTPIAEDPTGLRSLVAGLQGSPGTTAVVDPLAQPAEAGSAQPRRARRAVPGRPRRRRPTPTCPSPPAS